MSAVAERRLTLDEFYREFAGRRAYLIDGVPYVMPPPKPPHSTGVLALADSRRRAVPDDAHVRTENPLETGGANDPEPDIALIRGKISDYRSRHPVASDALLVAEVADTSLATDRRRKLPKYAEAGIAEVWIVNLNAGALEVYRRPRDGAYERHETYRRGDRVSPLFGGSVRVGYWVGA